MVAGLQPPMNSLCMPVRCARPASVIPRAPFHVQRTPRGCDQHQSPRKPAL